MSGRTAWHANFVSMPYALRFNILCTCTPPAWIGSRSSRRVAATAAAAVAAAAWAWRGSVWFKCCDQNKGHNEPWPRSVNDLTASTLWLAAVMPVCSVCPINLLLWPLLLCQKAKHLLKMINLINGHLLQSEYVRCSTCHLFLIDIHWLGLLHNIGVISW